MNPRSILAASAAVSYFWIVLAGIAEQAFDVENVKAASSALYASLSTVDIEVVENAWAREPYIRYIAPTNKAISAGWDEENSGGVQQRVVSEKSYFVTGSNTNRWKARLGGRYRDRATHTQKWRSAKYSELRHQHL